MVILVIIAGCTSQDASLRLPLEEVWRLEGEAGYNAAPLLSGEDLIIGDDSGLVTCVEASTGERHWTYQAKGKIRSGIEADEGCVIFSSDHQTIYALDQKDGHLLWQLDGREPVAKDDPYVVNRLSDSTFHKESVIIGNLDGSVYCVDRETGKVLWDYRTDAAFRTSPLIVDNVVYIGNLSGWFFALDAETGEALWTFKTHGHVFAPQGQILSGSVVVEDMIVFAANDMNVYALNRMNGDLKWVRHYPDQPIYSTPVVVEKKVLFSTYGFHYPQIMCVDQVGEDIWRFVNHDRLSENQEACGGIGSFNNEHSAYTASPVVVEKWVLIGSWDDHLYVLDLNSGLCCQEYEVNGSIGAAVAANADGVCVVTLDGEVRYLKWSP
jgi:outer membrane protein assembly factor BamB